MSSSQAFEETVAALRARGVSADAAPPDVDNTHRPWFVALLTGAAGWFAGVLLLCFIAIAFEPKSSVTIFVIGASLLAAAWVMYRSDREGIFLDQLALALSIAGQLAVAWSFLGDVKSTLVVAATLLALQLAIFVIMPNRAARTIAALFATIAWVYTLRSGLNPHSSNEDFWDDFEHTQPSASMMTLRWLLTWVPPLLLVWKLISRESEWMAGPLRSFARPLLTGLLLGIAAGGMATEPFMVFAFGNEAIGMHMSLWALFPLLSLALALVAAYGAFRLRSPGLIGFAVFAALVHLSRFYYFYGTTLTWKAVIMLCLGVALVGSALLVQARARETGAAS